MLPLTFLPHSIGRYCDDPCALFVAMTSSRLRPKSFSMTAAALRPGPPEIEPPGMRGGTGLVEAGDRHAVLRPAGRRPQVRGLRRVLRAAVAGAVPVVRIHALEIERALDHAGEDLVVGQIGREPPQVIRLASATCCLISSQCCGPSLRS